VTQQSLFSAVQNKLISSLCSLQIFASSIYAFNVFFGGQKLTNIFYFSIDLTKATIATWKMEFSGSILFFETLFDLICCFLSSGDPKLR